MGLYTKKMVSGLTKVYFAAIAAIGCMATGILWAAKLTKRVMALHAWARVLVRLAIGLSYRDTVEGMIRKAGETEEHGEVRATLLAIADQMRENPLLSLREAMQSQSFGELTPSDQSALTPLFESLGNAEAFSQHELIQAVRDSVELQINEARDAVAKNRRLAYSLGVIGGLALFLFLI